MTPPPSWHFFSIFLKTAWWNYKAVALSTYAKLDKEPFGITNNPVNLKFLVDFKPAVTIPASFTLPNRNKQ